MGKEKTRKEWAACPRSLTTSKYSSSGLPFTKAEVFALNIWPHSSNMVPPQHPLEIFRNKKITFGSSTRWIKSRPSSVYSVKYVKLSISSLAYIRTFSLCSVWNWTLKSSVCRSLVNLVLYVIEYRRNCLKL